MKVFIIVAVSIASMAGAMAIGAEVSADAKKAQKRSLWQLGSYYGGGFGDSLARSDDGHGQHGAGGYGAVEQHFGGGGIGGGGSGGAGWHQEYQAPVYQHQQQLHHPVHEWHPEQALHGQSQQHQFDEHSAPQIQHHFGGGSFEHGKLEQPASYDYHQQHQESAGGWGQQQQQYGGSSHEFGQHDEAKESEGGHGDWAPIAGTGSSDLHKEHSVSAITSELKEHQHQEWAPEGKEEGHHQEEHHHHTKIIKVPYPVHIEKPYPVYIEKPFIVEKPVPLKLYIKKKHH